MFIKTGNYPLITCCLRRQGKSLLNRSIGYAQGNSPAGLQENALIATPDTPVCLFSASKMITAMLIHLLDEKGEINLLDPVSYYIPEYGLVFFNIQQLKRLARLVSAEIKLRRYAVFRIFRGVVLAGICKAVVRAAFNIVG